MRWDKKPRPKDGAVRYKRRFAAAPTLISNKWVWLEFYWVRQQYTKHCFKAGGEWSYGTRVFFESRGTDNA